MLGSVTFVPACVMKHISDILCYWQAKNRTSADLKSLDNHSWQSELILLSTRFKSDLDRVERKAIRLFAISDV